MARAGYIRLELCKTTLDDILQIRLRGKWLEIDSERVWTNIGRVGESHRVDRGGRVFRQLERPQYQRDGQKQRTGAVVIVSDTRLENHACGTHLFAKSCPGQTLINDSQ